MAVATNADESVPPQKHRAQASSEQTTRAGGRPDRLVASRDSSAWTLRVFGGGIIAAAGLMVSVVWSSASTSPPPTELTWYWAAFVRAAEATYESAWPAMGVVLAGVIAITVSFVVSELADSQGGPDGLTFARSEWRTQITGVSAILSLASMIITWSALVVAVVRPERLLSVGILTFCATAAVALDQALVWKRDIPHEISRAQDLERKARGTDQLLLERRSWLRTSTRGASQWGALRTCLSVGVVSVVLLACVWCIPHGWGDDGAREANRTVFLVVGGLTAAFNAAVSAGAHLAAASTSTPRLRRWALALMFLYSAALTCVVMILLATNSAPLNVRLLVGASATVPFLVALAFWWAGLRGHGPFAAAWIQQHDRLCRSMREQETHIEKLRALETAKRGSIPGPDRPMQGRRVEDATTRHPSWAGPIRRCAFAGVAAALVVQSIRTTSRHLNGRVFTR